MDRQFVRQGERAQDKQRPDRGHEQPAEGGDEGRRRRHFVPALPSEDNVRLQQGDFDVAVEKHQGHGEEKKKKKKGDIENARTPSGLGQQSPLNFRSLRGCPH